MRLLNAVVPSLLYLDPMLPLAATITIFKATLDSDSVALKDKEQVVEVGDCLVK